MKHVIETGLARMTAPFSWATVGGGILFTAQVPLNGAGQLVGTNIREQTAQCLRNLSQTLAAVGATMDDVTQVVVFMTHLDDMVGMNEVYRQQFRIPYPNRATVIVAGLAVPGMRVEMLAYAALDGTAQGGAARTGRASRRARRSPASRQTRVGR